MTTLSERRPFSGRAAAPAVRGISWVRALNPPIYLISFLPVLSSLAATGGMRPWALVAAGVGVLLIQHGVNVLNDVTDWKRGADVEKADSWVCYHEGALAAAARHGRLSAAAGIAIGAITCVAAGEAELLLFAVPLVALGLAYNAGKKPLAYGSAGEWATGLCYGPGVAGCLYWIGGGRRLSQGLLLSAAYALLAVGVLLSHQPPQVLTDSVAGKRSFAVRHGASAAIRWARRGASAGLVCLALAQRGPISAAAAAAGVWVVNTGRVTPPRILLSSLVVALATLMEALR